MNAEHWQTIREALKFHRKRTMEFYVFDPAMCDEQLARIDAALAAVEAAQQPAPQAEWERVPPQTEARAWNKARWIVCDDGEVVIQYPDMGVRAPLPDGWELRRRPA